MGHAPRFVPIDPAIVRYYERSSEETRLEQGPFRLEQERTRELLRRFMPLPPATVVDVGGAAGAYSLWLADAGYHVHLVDPIPRLVAEARRRSALAARPILSCRVGEARSLDLADRTADVVLLLGPLYHLSARDRRLRALVEARRACRSGGFVAAAAISRFAPLLDMLARRGLEDDRVRANVADELERGARVAPSRRTSPFPDAYFHRVEELAEEVVEAGLTLEAIFGVEGPAALLVDLGARMQQPVARERVLWAARALETEPSVLGTSPHLLAVARRH